MPVSLYAREPLSFEILISSSGARRSFERLKTESGSQFYLPGEGAAKYNRWVRTLTLLFFTLRQLLRAAFVYNATRLLGAGARSRIRQKQTLRGARRAADLFVRLGGIYIKACQYLATVSNIFDVGYADIFRVPDIASSHSQAEIESRFLAQFGRPPSELFREFDPEPVATASLGQVHVARLHDGRKAAVKLLHNNIENQIREDLFALRFATRMILWFFPDLDFRGHLAEFAGMVLSEIDYENEAENLRRMRACFEEEPRVIVPAVIDELSRETVLTTEFINGIRVDDLPALDEARVERRTVTELLLETYVRMVFEHRFFHADPHPGNIFVIPADANHPLRIAFVDFGATQTVTQSTFSVLKRIFEVNRDRDFVGLVDLAVETGILTRDARRETYANLFEMIYSRYGSFKIEQDYYRINPLRFGRIIKLKDLNLLNLRLRDVLNDGRIPRRYIYLGRTMTLVISLALELDDKVNIFTIARPYVESYMTAGSANFFARLRSGQLPRSISNILSGGGDRRIARERQELALLQRRLFYELAQQGFMLFAGLAGLLIAAYLYLGGEVDIARAALLSGGGLLGWLFMRSARRRRRLFGKDR